MAKMVKVMTLRGTGVKGEHVPEFEIIEIDEKEAGILVGSGAALFVVNDAAARKEAEKRKQAKAESDAAMSAALGVPAPKPAVRK